MILSFKIKYILFFIVILWETAKDFTSQQWQMEYRLRNMWRVRAKAQAGVPWEHGLGMARSNGVCHPRYHHSIVQGHGRIWIPLGICGKLKREEISWGWETMNTYATSLVAGGDIFTSVQQKIKLKSGNEISWEVK